MDNIIKFTKINDYMTTKKPNLKGVQIRFLMAEKSRFELELQLPALLP